MTLIEDKKPKLVLAGPRDIGETLTFEFSYTEPEDIKIQVDGENLAYQDDYEVYLQGAMLKVAIAKESTITVYRETPLDQQAEFPQNNKFNSAKLNAALDKLTMQQQEKEEILMRCMKSPIDVADTFNSELPLPEKGKTIKVNKDGTGFEYSVYDPDKAVAITEANKEKSKEWATSDTVVEDGLYSSKEYARRASISETNAKTSETNASESETNAKDYADQAKKWATSDEEVEAGLYSSKKYATDVIDKYQEAMREIGQDDESGARGAAITAINEVKNNALDEIGRDNKTGLRKEAIEAINDQQSNALTSINNAKNTAIQVIGADVISANQAAAEARESAAKAIGWDIGYVDEDTLIFTDKTPEEIETNKNYIIETKDRALEEIASATEASFDELNEYVVEAQRASTAAQSAQAIAQSAANSTAQNKQDCIQAVADAQVKVVDAQHQAEAAAEQVEIARSEVNNARAQVQAAKEYAEEAETHSTNAETFANAADASAIQASTYEAQVHSATTQGVSTVQNAAAQQIATMQGYVRSAEESAEEAKEYAERAKFGWNIQFTDSTLLFTKLSEV